MTDVPKNPGDSPETARATVSAALQEQKTTFLMFRSDPQNEAAVGQVAAMADQLAQNQNPAEWRVLWIKRADLVLDLISQYFGNDSVNVAVSLRWGTGEPRAVVKAYQLDQLSDPIALGEAFSDAGPQT